jgi:hypothetical protein
MAAADPFPSPSGLLRRLASAIDQRDVYRRGLAEAEDAIAKVRSELLELYPDLFRGEKPPLYAFDPDRGQVAVAPTVQHPPEGYEFRIEVADGRAEIVLDPEPARVEEVDDWDRIEPVPLEEAEAAVLESAQDARPEPEPAAPWEEPAPEPAEVVQPAPQDPAAEMTLVDEPAPARSELVQALEDPALAPQPIVEEPARMTPRAAAVFLRTRGDVVLEQKGNRWKCNSHLLSDEELVMRAENMTARQRRSMARKAG